MFPFTERLYKSAFAGIRGVVVSSYPLVVGGSVILCLVVILNLAFFARAMLAAPDWIQVQYTPDDAYYYLVLARNFTELGSWTFDSGQTLTTGFHPLHAYLLAMVSIITQPDPGQFVQLGLLLSAAITMLAVGSGLLVAYRLREPIVVLVLALVASSQNVVFNSVSIVEWPLVVLISGLYFICLYRGLRTGHRRSVVLLFLLGVAGSLARSDFGLLPLSMFLATVYVGRLSRSYAGVRPALAGLLGATTGVAAVLAHNYLFTGQFLPSSALVKAHWATFIPDIVPVISTFSPDLLRITSPGSKRAIVWVAVPLLLALGVRLSRSCRSELAPLLTASSPAVVMLLGSSVTVIGYGYLYSRSAAIQPWYSSNTVIATLVVVTIVLLWLSRLLGRHIIALGLLVILLQPVLLNIRQLYPLGGSAAPWPHQSAMLAAGKYLAEAEPAGLVGSWNAGIIGYYQGGDVINLDGLVNNEVYPYMVENRLNEYIAQKGIRYVVDFALMFDSRMMRERGGYADAVLPRKPLVVYPDPPHSGEWLGLTLYALDR